MSIEIIIAIASILIAIISFSIFVLSRSSQGMHRDQTNQEQDKESSGGSHRQKNLPVLAVVGIMISFVGILAAIFLRFNSLNQNNTQATATTPAPINCPNRPLYDFDSGVMGWESQINENSQAIRQVKQSTEQAIGMFSLELQVILDGGDENKTSGEAFVDLRFDPPAGLEAPLDLEGVPITIWIYVPKKTVGDPQTPNGVQVFVKDQNFASEYGTWVNLTDDNTDKWISVTLTPSKAPPPLGAMQPGFNSSQIIIVGIKMGAGTGSAATYTGPIWIDSVCWPMP